MRPRSWSSKRSLGGYRGQRISSEPLNPLAETITQTVCYLTNPLQWDTAPERETLGIFSNLAESAKRWFAGIESQSLHYLS